MSYYGNYIIESENKTYKDFNFKTMDLEKNKDELDKYLLQDPDYKKEYKPYINLFKGEVITDGDKLVGYIFVYKTKYPGFITPVMVMKKYRGLKLGNKLLEDGISKYGAIDLTVKKSNKIAVHMYLKHDFVVLGDGNSKSEYYMKLKSKLTKEEKDKIKEI